MKGIVFDAPSDESVLRLGGRSRRWCPFWGFSAIETGRGRYPPKSRVSQRSERMWTTNSLWGESEANRNRQTWQQR